MISSVNVTKSIENCGFGRTTPEICPIEAKKCFVTQGKTNINRTLDLVYSKQSPYLMDFKKMFLGKCLFSMQHTSKTTSTKEVLLRNLQHFLNNYSLQQLRMTTPGTYIGRDKGKRYASTFLKIKKKERILFQEKIF